MNARGDHYAEADDLLATHLLRENPPSVAASLFASGWQDAMADEPRAIVSRLSNIIFNHLCNDIPNFGNSHKIASIGAELGWTAQQSVFPFVAWVVQKSLMDGLPQSGLVDGIKAVDRIVRP